MNTSESKAIFQKQGQPLIARAQYIIIALLTIILTIIGFWQTISARSSMVHLMLTGL
jgi:heme/copper-type cytochrome/quinol oxidase subunit 4